MGRDLICIDTQRKNSEFSDPTRFIALLAWDGGFSGPGTVDQAAKHANSVAMLGALRDGAGTAGKDFLVGTPGSVIYGYASAQCNISNVEKAVNSFQRIPTGIFEISGDHFLGVRVLWRNTSNRLLRTYPGGDVVAEFHRT